MMKGKQMTDFVVYSTETTVEKCHYARRHFAEKHAAKHNKLAGYPLFAVADRDTYNTKVVHMVERTNLMTGKKYMEPSNTPGYCSPSRESYWSM